MQPPPGAGMGYEPSGMVSCARLASWPWHGQVWRFQAGWFVGVGGEDREKTSHWLPAVAVQRASSVASQLFYNLHPSCPGRRRALQTATPPAPPGLS